jgi:nitronate monooxygenase
MDSEVVEFLNTLGEAERAGGRVLHDLEQEASSLELRELLRKAAHDEGYWAGQIGTHIRRLGGEPSNRTGDFVDKVRALGDLKSKIELLNRGQRWVIRKIEERLPALSDPQLRAFLVVMAQGHRVNIQAVDDALKSGAL